MVTKVLINAAVDNIIKKTVMVQFEFNRKDAKTQ